MEGSAAAAVEAPVPARDIFDIGREEETNLFFRIAMLLVKLELLMVLF